MVRDGKLAWFGSRETFGRLDVVVNNAGPTAQRPYQPTIGAFAELVRAGSGREANDPRRVAQVVGDLAGRRRSPPATRPGEG